MNLRLPNKFFLINFLVVTLIFILDRFSKIFVINLAEGNIDQTLFVFKYLNIHLIWNKGVAFGFFSFDEAYTYNIITILIIVIISILVIMVLKSNGFRKYALLSILGGALGNLYDRFFYSAVPDFIDFHIEEFHWFIFNIADIFITLGVIVMIMTEFFVKDSNSYEKI